MKEAEWARELRECGGVQERQEHPAYIPWVHKGGRDELRSMGLAQLARVLDHFLAAIWKRGVPSQIVQEMRDTQEPMVRRAKEAVRHQSQRAINRAFRILLSHGEELQRAVEGDGSSTTGQSQIEEWGDDEDDDENASEVVSVAGSARESPKGSELRNSWEAS